MPSHFLYGTKRLSQDILLYLHDCIILILSGLVDNLCKGQELIGLKEICDNGIISIMKAYKRGSTSWPSYHHIKMLTTIWVYTLLLSTYHHEGIMDNIFLK